MAAPRGKRSPKPQAESKPAGKTEEALEQLATSPEGGNDLRFVLVEIGGDEATPTFRINQQGVSRYEVATLLRMAANVMDGTHGITRGG